ncbi:MAG: transcriptional repressor LexA [Nitrospiraceae bacterium]
MKPDELKRRRQALGLTQEELAQELRTTRMTVTRYEGGTRRIPGVVDVILKKLTEKRVLPMAGVVAAGSPIEPIAQSDLIEVPQAMIEAGGTMVLRIKGESMRDEGILPGDYVVVRKQHMARNGQAVIALLNREATIKTFVRRGAHVELHPANPAMRPIPVHPTDEFHIEGVVVGVIRHCN